MCNLYPLSKGRSEVARLAHAMSDLNHNHPPLSGIYAAASGFWWRPTHGARRLQRSGPKRKAGDQRRMFDGRRRV